jgi:PDZ domain-containing protein
MRRPLRSAGSILLIAGAIGVSWIRLPYYSFGPGPAREVTPLIHVEDDVRTYGSSGHLVMTTIRFDKLTALGMLATWIDPDRSVEAEDVVYPPGLTPAEETHRAISQMDQSKIDAAAIVLRQLTDYPKEHGVGALVEAVGSDCPADDHLFPGDLIVRIDGESVDSRREASRLIDAVPIDQPIEFRIEADGQTHDVRLTRGRCPPIDDPLLGIVLIEPFPFEITIESAEVGGPSAGLMWALGLYDLLTPGDLTQGRRIAGTGAIDLEGNIGSIGGVSDKVVAAQSVDADILLIPRGNLEELRGVDTGDVRLIAVSTLDEALAALDPSLAGA